MKTKYDKIIIGSGIYGLYSALFCGKKKQRVLVLEQDPSSFSRATYINQARVHQGYHYPRSLSTALKSAHYFDRFNKDYDFCINSKFEKIYAISSKYSWTSGKEFEAFCKAANIPCEKTMADKFFRKNMVEEAFVTQEYTYDAKILCKYFLDELVKLKNVTIKYKSAVTDIRKDGKSYIVTVNEKDEYETGYVLNATYASTNQIIDKLGFEKFKIKYEKCEIILCKPSDELNKYGITVMDGPFFSIMPFGKSQYHSLTSVTFTPHETSYDELPTFNCQDKCKGYCGKNKLGNCNNCIAKPDTAYPYMSNLANKYLKDEYSYEYSKSLYSIKPILTSSEVDDSRPTVIRKFSSNPTFVSVLSGKINTVYDLQEVLDE